MNPPRPPDEENRKPPSLARAFKTVAWSFLGIRKKSEYQEDLARVSPFHIIGVGIFCLLVFVLLLVVVAKWAASA